jgi:Zn2+/Cd2+-exporting ATPase
MQQVKEHKSVMMRVQGMDCGACATKVENAMKGLPGVTDISMNFATEIVSFKLDVNRTSPDLIERKIESLGYRPTRLNGSVVAKRPTAVIRSRHSESWFDSPKLRLTVGLGILLGVAFSISLYVPSVSQWVFSVAAIIGLFPFAHRALTAAFSGTPFSIEMLMTIAAVGAVAIGAAEEAAIVIFLFAVGEMLESVAAGRARAGIESLLDLVPKVARVVRGTATVEVPADQLQVGDIVIVRPGDRIPSDGTVLEGQSEVDQAPITGESAPSLKKIGDHVYAGSINAHGTLRVSILKTVADNTIARIIHLVETAQGSKAPTARFIDRFSSYYTPAAMVSAALVILIPPLMFDADWATWVYRGLATLLIACPCALVISTPAAIASGLAAGARHGLLIKGGAALETLGKTRTIAFDKTGTLTRGSPTVTDVIALEGSQDDVLSKAAAIEKDTSHPIGLAITAAAQRRGLTIPPTFGGTAIAGKAFTARLREGFGTVGSPRYATEVSALTETSVLRIKALEEQGKTVVVLLLQNTPTGLIAVRDEPREDAAQGISRLKELGINPVILTGDNHRTGQAIGAALGISVRSELLPEEKLRAIDELKTHGPVTMVGDGINDAPALATADVGVAMGGGTDVALETADAALLKNRVVGVAELILLSRATILNIWQNIAIALGLKGFFLVSTLAGTTSLWMAILADTGATVLVTANALRLLTFFRSSSQPTGKNK